MKKGDLNPKAATSTTIQESMNKAKAIMLTAALAICFAFPVNTFSQSFRAMLLGGRSEQTTTSQAAATTTCSQSSAKQIIYSGDARANVMGASWSAAAAAVAIITGIFGLNDGVKSEMYCEEIR